MRRPRPHGRSHPPRAGSLTLRPAAALGDAVRRAPDRHRRDRRPHAAHPAAQAIGPRARAPGGRHGTAQPRGAGHGATAAHRVGRAPGGAVAPNRGNTRRGDGHPRVARRAGARQAHSAARARQARVRVEAIATQLDTRARASGDTVNRYMVYHRLWIRPGARWTAAFWEASVLSGVGRQLEPWYLNIATLGTLRQTSSGANVNGFWGVDLERRATTTLFGQFMLDDIQVSRKTP